MGQLAECVPEPAELIDPATIRADADLAETVERMKNRHVESLIVSTPDGLLLGVLVNQPGRSRRDHNGRDRRPDQLDAGLAEAEPNLTFGEQRLAVSIYRLLASG